MAFEFDGEDIKASEVSERITAVLLAPIVLPLSAGIDQPLVKTTIKEAIAFSQRCQEAVANTRERFEDVMAEAKAELDEEQTASKAIRPLRRPHSQGTSAVAVEIINIMSELNTRFDWLTQGKTDLRLLMPLGLGALALRQILIKGLQIDELPWYALAWYAFDSFTKLNETESRQHSERER